MMLWLFFVIFIPVDVTSTTIIDEEEITEKLEILELNVDEVITELYRLEQVIAETMLKIAEVEAAIHLTEGQIQETQLEIEATKAILKTYEATLGQVLLTYQRLGTTSFLEIILEAENLKGFLRRLTVLRDMTKGTGELMSQLDETLSALVVIEERLQDEKLELLLQQEALELAIIENQNTKQEQERYLSSLYEEREGYEEQLNTLRKAWQQLKPVFKKASQGFSALASSGALTEDMIEITYTLLGITARISDSNFNLAIKENPSLPPMTFDFTTEGVNIELSNGVLELEGYFEVVEDYKLRYVATAGVFYGIPLEPSGIAELFEEGTLILDIENLTGGNKVKAVGTKNKEMILNIAFSLF